MLMICPLGGGEKTRGSSTISDFSTSERAASTQAWEPGGLPDEIDVIVETSAQASGRHLIQPQDRLVRICDPEGTREDMDWCCGTTANSTAGSCQT